MADAPAAKASRQITIVGAGIAGASVAWQLANHGWQVRVLDAAAPGAGGSGNAAAILYPKLVSAELTPSHIQSLAFLRALAIFRDARLAPHFHGSGVLWLQTRKQRVSINAEHPWWQRQVWALSATEASEKAGIPLHVPALWLPHAGIIDPVGLLATLLGHPNIELLCQHEVTQIQRNETGWQLSVCHRQQDQRLAISLHTECLVLAVAGAAASLLGSQHLPLRPVRGQISTFPSTLPLKTTLCYGGYITPALHAQHVLGATFQPGRDDCSPCQEDQIANADALTEAVPSVIGTLPLTTSWKARASVRWQTPDYLPLVGWLPWPRAYELALSAQSASRPIPRSVSQLPKLGITLGHGSKGFSQAWLAADLLCQALLGDEKVTPESIGLDQATLLTLSERLRPDRFLLKAWKRGQLRPLKS